ncbi:sporulation histidine kinase inhibitor Sda [Halalkalibacter urbisdiaboli]|uniref:sporulation histidine kinase inhibitor Sda n=1 Tax=Halalkalibacter urbisdiaboli TaxID=1960589 RepID=UPI000B44FAC1|nr:sporulation histidine kinase inhibitor Sda [Halalkalibacter urbisdiaboli]
MLKYLDDQTILDAYKKSIELNLDKDFILILKKEVESRLNQIEEHKELIKS